MPRQDVLTSAKAANKNEFYTQYEDIEKEVNAYVEYNPDVFRDKVILLPCDDPEWSNFTKYFAVNFERFRIRKLISTSYAKGWANNHQITIFDTILRLKDYQIWDVFFALAKLNEGRRSSATLTGMKQRQGGKDAQ